eukprot:RCo001006
MKFKWLWFLFLIVANGDEGSHTYEDGEIVKVWVNKIGPFNNPLETYPYFSLPLCRPSAEEWSQKFPSLGEALQGDELVQHAKLRVQFKRDVEKQTICTQRLTADEAQVLHGAVLLQYWYQFYVDDLPMWATIGKVIDVKPEPVPHIYLHQHLSIGYNADRIVMVNLTTVSEAPVPATEGGELTFTYSVKWVPSPLKYEQRFRRYLENEFFEHKIHWFSIVNSFMLVVLLAAFVLAILTRTLRADYQRYSQEKDFEDEDEELTEDSGWKQCHADAFRVPTHPCLFCAVVGTGFQLCFLAFFMILFSIMGMMYASRGAHLTYFIILWAVTTYLAGFYSGSLFLEFTLVSPVYSGQWIRTMAYTAMLFPGLCAGVVFLMNFVAWGYHSSQAIPFGTMVVLALIWGFVSFPLAIFGTMMGRHSRRVRPSQRVSTVPRTIPPKAWYFRRLTLVLLGGILPFGSIFIELYFVFTSFWNYKFYYVYGFLFLVFMILLVVLACVSTVTTYFLLNAEDYRWQWTSFLIGCSTGVYTFLYAAYFFRYKTKMSGLLMTLLYFGYMALLSFGFSLLAGAVCFLAARQFVWRIYRNLKLD